MRRLLIIAALPLLVLPHPPHPTQDRPTRKPGQAGRAVLHTDAETGRLRAQHEAWHRQQQIAWRYLEYLAAVETWRQAVEASRRTRPTRSAGTPARPQHPPAQTPSGCGFADAIRSLWPAEAADRMILVAWRESRCSPGAASPTGCLGLLQICWPLHRALVTEQCGGDGARELLFDPACNLRVGRALWGRNGWAPWRATA